MTNKFNDIENQDLRTWNRCATIFNLWADHSKEAAMAYAADFSKEDKIDISAMFAKIRKDGYENTRTQLNREMQVNAAS